MYKFKLGLLLLIFFALNVSPSVSMAEQIYRENWVIAPGNIPANHGSSLVELPSGDVKACWYAGSAEKGADVQILCSDWNSKTDVWSAPKVAIPRQQKAAAFPFFKATTLGNPALYLDDDQKLWLFYSNVSIFNGWSGAHVDFKVSNDFGKSWGKAREFQSFFGNLTRNKPIKLDNHRFMVPLYHELIGRDGFTCTVIPKNGKVWDKECHRIFGSGEIQPTLVFQGSRLFSYMRVHQHQNMRMAEFDFKNDMWSKTSDTNLPNSDSAVDAVSTP
ncbi:MAG: exo-alpha-sialidase, partial [Bdellovibrionota bacterium]